MTTLTIRGLSKAYDTDAPVLRGVDLEVPGGLTSVLGSSGCGKTTLLRIVAGFLEPDAGTIALDGKVVAGDGRSVSPRRRRVGYVPQEGALFPHLDVAGNISFGLPRSARSHGHRLEEMLDLVELPRTIRDRRPHELSGGQQQRVALARALAPEPDVVLLDEPFSSLDAGLRESTGQAVARALRASGTTGVLVTHDQGEALSLSDQVAVMREGRLVQVAAPTDLYLSPVDSTVAGFVGGAVLLDADVDGLTGTCAIGRLDVRPSVVDGTHGSTGVARVAIRPEQITLHPDAVRGVPAEVVGVSFFGHDTTVQTKVIPDGPTVVARISHGRIPAAGEKVGLEVTGDVIAFPAEPVR